MTAAPGPGTTAVIDRLAVTWHAAAPILDESRLDRVIRLLLDGALEEALEQGGIDRDEVVCVRAVEAPPYAFRWEQTDADIVRRWSRSIAGAVHAAAGSGAGEEIVVRYRSRAHAVVDAVVRAAIGDLSRTWAWQQLGLSPAGADAAPADPGPAVGRLLVDYPELAVWAIVGCARVGRLASLVALVGRRRFAEAVDGSWQAAGGRALQQAWPAPDADQWASTAAAIMGRSSVARAAVAEAVTIVAGLGEETRPADRGISLALPRAVAAAIVLECEPSAAAQGSCGVALVAATARLLTGPAAGASEVPPPLEVGPGTSAHDDLGGKGTPGAGGRSTDTAPRGEEPHPEALPSASGEGDASPDEDDSVLVPRAGGEPRTGWGGLLFLLHLVEGPRLSARGIEDPVLGGTGLRALLYALGRDLLARAAPDVGYPDRDDPALIAFAGLAPGEEPPDLLAGAADPPARAAGRRLVSTEADTLVEQLRARLGEGLGEARESALLVAVCRRRAVVEAEPGWVDVRLDLDEVSTDIRRAGLDLDPGYLPWLGRVVRFRYG